MVTIGRVGGFKIQVYADDHYPPHFHVVGADFEVMVRLTDLVISRGMQHQREIEAALFCGRVSTGTNLQANGHD